MQADPALGAHRLVAGARVAVRGHPLEAVIRLAGEPRGEPGREAVGFPRDFTE
jgi:hypothetical protein